MALGNSAFLILVLSTTTLMMTSIGDVPLATYAKGIMYNYIAQGLLLWGICLVKLSVGYALLRIAARKSFKMIIISIMVFMTVYTIACFVVSSHTYPRCLAVH